VVSRKGDRSARGEEMIRFHMIQGMLLGIEWDYQNRWFSLNFLIIKVVIDYNKRGIGYGY
jgi:hypothetical protein